MSRKKEESGEESRTKVRMTPALRSKTQSLRGGTPYVMKFRQGTSSLNASRFPPLTPIDYLRIFGCSQGISSSKDDVFVENYRERSESYA